MSTDPTPSKILTSTSLEEEEAAEEEATAATSPLHMHVALGAVLPGKPLPPTGVHLSSRSSSRSRSSLRSNSRSPSPQQQQQQGAVGTPHHRSNLSTASSTSTSMEFLDEDILTDKMGMLELESQPCHVKPLLEQQGNKLPSVNERMSEETLDDVHAFSDFRNVIRQMKITSSTPNNETGNSGTISSTSSDGARSIGGSSYVDQGHLLETLLEFEEDDDDDEDDEEEEEKKKKKKHIHPKDPTNAKEKLKKLKDKASKLQHDPQQQE